MSPKWSSIEVLLHKAVENDNLKELKELIKQQINSKEGEKHKTLLHKASKQGYLQMVKFLIEMGAEMKPRLPKK